ncbi:pyruvate kinase [Actinomadura scrupuli]|uniref:pyruvate kinase n=1 Tax=Actinomadura scrupuli TaxID=559629 RepID=UPI003D983688
MTSSQLAGPWAEVLEELADLRVALASAEATWASRIASVDPRNRASAVNLAHYWALRQYDLRDLQGRLAGLGLSSLGRCEPHVQATVNAVAAVVSALSGHGAAPDEPSVDFEQGQALLRRRAAQLLGDPPATRRARIMVTLPSQAAGDENLIGGLLDRGMDLARINCAYDGPQAWAAMISHLRAAADGAGRDCRVAMDLAGPKVRTGPLAEGPAVVKLQPVRDVLGRVVTPARCRLIASGEPPPAGEAMPWIPVPGDWLARRLPGEPIHVVDARGARRHLRIERAGLPDQVVVSAARTVYLSEGTILRVRGAAGVPVGPLRPAAQALTLRRGDILALTRDCTPMPVSDQGPHRIGCTLPEVFGQARVGDRVHFDDGKIGGLVTASDTDQIEVRITEAAATGSRLRAGKGINLPDTTLPVPALTGKDRTDLEFVTAHADLVELSFVRDAQDVEDLLSALTRLGGRRLGVIVKIETLAGFENLPEILFALLRWPHSGVMIARGDLAVECGLERMAELQEEILWLCEAAHVPVVWATQVLDRLARSGRPSRAEITDAAMGVRAECVMLNKGPHILEAVTALGDILGRMAAHQDKKTALLRQLRSWRPGSAEGRGPR